MTNRVFCTNCREYGHPAWDCKKPRTATNFPIANGDGLPSGEPGANASEGVTGGESAATIPVQDARPMKARTVATVLKPEAAQETQILRPGPKFDKVAYQRAYMREYRKRKASKHSEQVTK